MTSPTSRPGRTTALVGVALAVVLVLAYAVVSRVARTDAPPPLPVVTVAPGPSSALPAPPTPSPTPTAPTPATAVPRRGKAYPVRELGALGETSVLASGLGNADLRYRRAPGNGTRVHFICTGCDADTWVVEVPPGAPVAGGPLPDPADATGAVDTDEPGRTTDLLVRARGGASWTLTLTPFDLVPLHEQTFDALDDDVVAVRTRGDLRLTCPGPFSARTFARSRGVAEYAVGQVLRHDAGGTVPLPAPRGTDRMLVAVSCPGRWTLALP